MNEAGFITAEELKKRLDTNQVDFLFDLRNEDEFKSWRIEGRTEFQALNIPQEEFVGEEERHLARFPKGKEIVAVCAHGDSSKYAANLLTGIGLSAVSLQGGMDTWSGFYETHRIGDDPAVYQVFRVARGCLAYLVVSRGFAVVIDSSRHFDRIEDLAQSRSARIVRVLDTHLHADHISGGRELAEKSGAPYCLHPADAGGASYPYIPLADRQSFTFGAGTIDVIHSPGHTPGSTSFLLNKRYLFTGDTIMKTGIGRPDLGGKAREWAALLYDTLFGRFKELPDNVIVLPSHATSLQEQDAGGIIMTTLGRARKELDLFQIRDEAAFVRHIEKSLLENPERYQDIRKVNLGMLRPDEAKQKELEIGKNLCGMAQKTAA
jgi:glyoxylase-like metal-dependent hydrolase (beta-lactamase superfamily II)/rhodanese-related sulfurtransferase